MRPPAPKIRAPAALSTVLSPCASSPPPRLPALALLQPKRKFFARPKQSGQRHPIYRDNLSHRNQAPNLPFLSKFLHRAINYTSFYDLIDFFLRGFRWHPAILTLYPTPFSPLLPCRPVRFGSRSSTPKPPSQCSERIKSTLLSTRHLLPRPKSRPV